MVKKQKKKAISEKQKKDIKPDKKNEIELLPIFIDPDSGMFLNIHLFGQLLPIMEEHAVQFGDDFTASIENYPEWLNSIIQFAGSLNGWIFAVMVDGVASGGIWAYNWEESGYSVTIAGFARAGTPISVTKRTIHLLVDKIFDESEVYVIRAESAESNRASILAMLRAGLRGRNRLRAWKLQNGKEITGIINSITRPERELTRVKEQDTQTAESTELPELGDLQRRSDGEPELSGSGDEPSHHEVQFESGGTAGEDAGTGRHQLDSPSTGTDDGTAAAGL